MEAAEVGACVPACVPACLPAAHQFPSLKCLPDHLPSDLRRPALYPLLSPSWLLRLGARQPGGRGAGEHDCQHLLPGRPGAASTHRGTGTHVRSQRYSQAWTHTPPQPHMYMHTATATHGRSHTHTPCPLPLLTLPPTPPHPAPDPLPLAPPPPAPCPCSGYTASRST